MDRLTFTCFRRTESRTSCMFEFMRTNWQRMLDPFDPDNSEFEDCDPSHPDAFPDERATETMKIVADPDEYEVGRRYAFICTGVIERPEDQD